MPIGKAAKNPILDTREYIVKFPDDLEEEYQANVIAESMFSQCDTEGVEPSCIAHFSM